MENTLCNWAVCYDIDGSNYDDHQTRTAWLFRLVDAIEGRRRA